MGRPLDRPRPRGWEFSNVHPRPLVRNDRTHVGVGTPWSRRRKLLVNGPSHDRSTRRLSEPGRSDYIDRSESLATPSTWPGRPWRPPRLTNKGSSSQKIVKPRPATPCPPSSIASPISPRMAATLSASADPFDLSRSAYIRSRHAHDLDGGRICAPERPGNPTKRRRLLSRGPPARRSGFENFDIDER